MQCSLRRFTFVVLALIACCLVGNVKAEDQEWVSLFLSSNASSPGYLSCSTNIAEHRGNFTIGADARF